MEEKLLAVIVYSFPLPQTRNVGVRNILNQLLVSFVQLKRKVCAIDVLRTKMFKWEIFWSIVGQFCIVEGVCN